MAKLRSNIVHGPTGRRPLLGDAQRARENRLLRSMLTFHPPTPSPARQRVEKGRPASPGGPKPPPTTIVTHATLDITPADGVSILDELEPVVRALRSPCGNFMWTRSEIVQVYQSGHDGSPGAHAIPDEMVEKLRINAIHHDANHDGNITTAAKGLAARAGIFADNDDGQREVMSLDDIGKVLESLEIVFLIVFVKREEKKMLAWGCKTMGPNMMGNKFRFPEPWMESRVARLQKIQEEKMSNSNTSRKTMHNKPTDGQLDGSVDSWLYHSSRSSDFEPHSSSSSSCDASSDESRDL